MRKRLDFLLLASRLPGIGPNCPYLSLIYP